MGEEQGSKRVGVQRIKTEMELLEREGTMFACSKANEAMNTKTNVVSIGYDLYHPFVFGVQKP